MITFVKNQPVSPQHRHTHPPGHSLIVAFGCRWVQRKADGRGNPARDVVWFPPGEKHWHGATLTMAMMHTAIQEVLNGKNIDWIETLSEEQYRK